MARKISNLSASYIRDSDWLNFIQFLGYKYKIRLVSILRKRENQALISISIILKFSAQIKFLFSYFFLLRDHKLVPKMFHKYCILQNSFYFVKHVTETR